MSKAAEPSSLGYMSGRKLQANSYFYGLKVEELGKKKSN